MNFEGSNKFTESIKNKFESFKTDAKTRIYTFLIGIVIGTIIIIIVNVTRKAYNKTLSKPADTECTNFKNRTENAILTIALFITLYLSLPQYI